MSSSAPALTWEFQDTPITNTEPWKAVPPPEEDHSLEESLEGIQALVTEEFDGEEPTILRDAFDRAATFLRIQSREMKKRLGCFAPAPVITPGPDGSADLQWERPAWALLINVPSGSAPASFYGEGPNNSRIKGAFDPSSWNLGIVSWLSKV